MATLGVAYEKGADERRKLDEKFLAEAIEAEERKKKNGGTVSSDIELDDTDESVDDKAETSIGGMWGFAKFMAKGVKKTIVKAVNSVQDMVDDGGELLHPRDPRPLCPEEMQAIMLMQAFCPRQSTPDHTIGAGKYKLKVSHVRFHKCHGVERIFSSKDCPEYDE
jgi:ribosomal protein S9